MKNGKADLTTTKMLEDMERIKNIWFDGNRIFMRTDTGNVLSRPLEAYPELKEATTEQRNDYTIWDDGQAIRWDAIDADLHISSFYDTTEPNEQNEVARIFKSLPWLNVSEVARAVGISKSLLTRYIYGITSPSKQRVEQIRNTLHGFAREMQMV